MYQKPPWQDQIINSFHICNCPGIFLLFFSVPLKPFDVWFLHCPGFLNTLLATIINLYLMTISFLAEIFSRWFRRRKHSFKKIIFFSSYFVMFQTIKIIKWFFYKCWHLCLYNIKYLQINKAASWVRLKAYFKMVNIIV